MVEPSCDGTGCLVVLGRRWVRIGEGRERGFKACWWWRS